MWTCACIVDERVHASWIKLDFWKQKTAVTVVNSYLGDEDAVLL